MGRRYGGYSPPRGRSPPRGGRSPPRRRTPPRGGRSPRRGRSPPRAGRAPSSPLRRVSAHASWAGLWSSLSLFLTRAPSHTDTSPRPLSRCTPAGPLPLAGPPPPLAQQQQPLELQPEQQQPQPRAWAPPLAQQQREPLAAAAPSEPIQQPRPLREAGPAGVARLFDLPWAGAAAPQASPHGRPRAPCCVVEPEATQAWSRLRPVPVPEPQGAAWSRKFARRHQNNAGKPQAACNRCSRADHYGAPSDSCSAVSASIAAAPFLQRRRPLSCRSFSVARAFTSSWGLSSL
jgi:hypothetical protein